MIFNLIPKKSASPRKSQRKRNLNKISQQSRSKQTVVVAGDSIIKYVKGWELSSADQSVSVKSFPGATADDMVDFLKPTLRRKPDKLAIHAGTNDVSSSTPKVIADKVSKTKSDSQELAAKVNETNNLLKLNCARENWLFLDNGNIGRSYLNHRFQRHHRQVWLGKENVPSLHKTKDDNEISGIALSHDNVAGRKTTKKTDLGQSKVKIC